MNEQEVVMEERSYRNSVYQRWRDWIEVEEFRHQKVLTVGLKEQMGFRDYKVKGNNTA